MKRLAVFLLTVLTLAGLVGCTEMSPYPVQSSNAPRGAMPVGNRGYSSGSEAGGIPLRVRTPVFGPNSNAKSFSPGRLSITPPPAAEPKPAVSPRAATPSIAPPAQGFSSAPAPSPAVNPPSPSGGFYRLRTLDLVLINLSGIPDPEEMKQKIDEAGFISLPFIGAVQARGLTTAELEARIEQRYLDSKIYRSINVTVLLPSQAYFIQGEVRKPGKYEITTGMKLMQAVAAAGGYTEFANPKKVKVIRGDQILDFNLKDVQKNPELDIAIEAGDVIQVDRSLW